MLSASGKIVETRFIASDFFVGLIRYELWTRDESRLYVVRTCWRYPFINQLALSFYRREGRVSRSIECNGLIHHVYTNETPRASE